MKEEEESEGRQKPGRMSKVGDTPPREGFAELTITTEKPGVVTGHYHRGEKDKTHTHTHIIHTPTHTHIMHTHTHTHTHFHTRTHTRRERERKRERRQKGDGGQPLPVGKFCGAFHWKAPWEVRTRCAMVVT